MGLISKCLLDSRCHLLDIGNPKLAVFTED